MHRLSASQTLADAALFSQVQTLSRKGATLAEVRSGIHMEKFSDFRQYPQFQATFADNAETIYQQLQKH